ncbi:hypothetical protein BDN70DRAFT_896854 [Pholiota conissans]|uniref:Uncharacterized protein n=1 Tax=Pholiota conissans TaxID=109636 RepID=A0A9P6CXZ7_9AGAR|nr:hypothetical protein BDN70DRAFT_896854 [Pholiota conissans]
MIRNINQPEYEHHNIAVLKLGGRLLRRLISGTYDPNRALNEYVLLTDSDIGSARYIWDLFGAVDHIYREKSQYITPLFLKAARTTLQRTAVQILRFLASQEEVEPLHEYVDIFRRLLRLFAITLQSIREQLRVEKRCCALICPARESGVRPLKKRVDWKYHKAECKLLTRSTKD